MFKITCLIIFNFSFLIFNSPAQGQIIPDASLGGESSVVTPNIIQGLPAQRIDGGAVRGGNLFHSFQEFNIPPGRGAYFANPDGVTNILGRVTGNNPSNIFGTLGVLGNANLFFINPNGIIFGPNARLDLRGSFLASSASAVVFNGWEFNTVNPQAPPLLTVNIPVGLRFRENPGNIRVIGPGHNIRINPQTGTFDYRNRPVGLQVDANRTLALVGGDVVLTGGNLTAASGRIELGSVRSAGLVNFTPPSTTGGLGLDYTGASNFGDIRFAPVASATTRGESGGTIQIQGKRVAIAQGSIIDSSTLGGGVGGNLTVRGSEAVEVAGNIPGTPIPSFLLAQVQPGATGKGGDITVETPSLRLSDGGQISAITFGRGDAGNLTVRATTSLEMLGTSPDSRLPSALATAVQPGASGKGGNLTLDTQRLLVTGGAQIATSTQGQGDAGSLTVRAQTVELRASASGQLPSGLRADVAPTATGRGGDLRLETQRLLVADGAQIGAATLGRGNGGNLTVVATDVELRGGTADGRFPSVLTTGVSSTATGRGGNLTLATQRLLLTRGAQITTSTFGQGDAGSLTVRAQTVELLGGFASGQFPSGLRADVAPTATGRGGDLLLDTQRLLVADGAQIGAGTFGRGNGGKLTIVATDVELRGRTADGRVASGLFTSVEPPAIGNGGALRLDTQRLLVTGGAQITSSTRGQGDAGSLTVNAQTVELSGTAANQSPSALFASVGRLGTGRGGDLTVNTERLQVDDGARVAVSDDSGVKGPGTLQVTADTIRLNNRAGIEANTIGGQEEQGSITLQSRDIQLRRNSNISTNAGANARGGNITINSDILLAFPRENSDITANARTAQGGRVTINVPNIFGMAAITREQLRTRLGLTEAAFAALPDNPTFLLPSSDIAAISQAGGPNLQGTVTFGPPGVNPAQSLVELPQNIVDPASLIAANPCLRGAGSEFIITGRGGLPTLPSEPLGDTAVRVDWSDLPASSVGKEEAEGRGQGAEAGGRGQGAEGRRQGEEGESITHYPLPITPAQGWIMNDKGEVTLTADNPNGVAFGRRLQPQIFCPSQ